MASSQAKWSLTQSHSQSKLEERLFLIAFSCYVFATWFSSTGYQSFFGLDYNWFRRIIYCISLLLLAGKYYLQGNSLKEHLLVISVGAAFVASALITDDYLLLLCYIFIACARHISIKPISFCLFMVLIVIGLITFTGYFFGVIPGSDLASTATRSTRYSLGFSHPNTLALFLLSLQLCWISMRHEFLSIKDLIILIAFALSAHFLTYSRTADGAFSFIIIVEIALLIRRRNPTYKNPEKGFMPQFLLYVLLAAIVAMVTFSIFSMLFYDGTNPMWATLDNISSGRLSLAHQFYSAAGITAFGQSFEDSAVQYLDIHGEAVTFLVDNLYCNVLLRYGLVAWVLSFTGVTVALHRLKHGRQYIWLLGIFEYLLIGLFEALFFKLNFNFFALGLKSALYIDDTGESAWHDSSLTVIPLYSILCAPSVGKH